MHQYLQMLTILKHDNHLALKLLLFRPKTYLNAQYVVVPAPSLLIHDEYLQQCIVLQYEYLLLIS